MVHIASWWPNGLFANSGHGVPSLSDVQVLIEKLLSQYIDINAGPQVSVTLQGQHLNPVAHEVPVPASAGNTTIQVSSVSSSSVTQDETPTLSYPTEVSFSSISGALSSDAVFSERPVSVQPAQYTEVTHVMASQVRTLMLDHEVASVSPAVCEAAADFDVYAQGKFRQKFASGLQAFTLQDWLSWNTNDRYHRADAYTRAVGDDVGLFFAILLTKLPLHMAADVWSDSEQRYIRPRNHDKDRFHKNYCIEFLDMRGTTPRLTTWLLTCGKFLTKKLFVEKRDAHGNTHLVAKKNNDFRWKDFQMTLQEIHDVSVAVTLDFAMAILSYDD
eukprot:1295240-Karenia_brevis.AAC.1